MILYCDSSIESMIHAVAFSYSFKTCLISRTNLPFRLKLDLVYSAFHQHFDSDITSASFAFNWSHGRGDTVTCAAQRRHGANTEKASIFFVMVLPKCWWNPVYHVLCIWAPVLLGIFIDPNIIFLWRNYFST